ncbi:MAG TPA: DNA translocase FtsK 4TM domain-containing protein, partial [Pirellulales bacterium]|nr:DNA translocase FtsK 4TM domain-containing protein [Pirellulales bacterium]
MPDERNLKADLAALALLALTVFLAVALCTYDPHDPPANLVHPPRTVVYNACGKLGALAAHGLFQAIGLGAYYLLISLGVLDAALLRRKAIGDRWLRTIGWALSLVGVTVLAAIALPRWSPGPVIGSGGFLGAAGHALLELHVATAGAYILLVSLVVGGWLLSTDYLLLRVTSWFMAKGAQRMAVSFGRADRHDESRRKRRSDLGHDDDLSEAAGSSAVRIRRKGRDELDEYLDDEEPDDADEPGETDDEPAGEAKVGEVSSNSAESQGAGEVRVRPPLKKRDERQEVMRS